jgi:aminobenzoyl-glutamate transport protein
MKKYLPHIALSLFAAQLLLMLISWLYSAAVPVSNVHSLLSSEGLRWMLGHFAETMASPLLVWLLLVAMAYGCLVKSGLPISVKSYTSENRGYRERRALNITCLLLVVCVAIILSLSIVPHAIMLSATGKLWPSPFSASLVPIIAFCLILLSSVYGMISGKFDTIRDVYDSLLYGLRCAAPWLLFYILIGQLIASLHFMF